VNLATPEGITQFKAAVFPEMSTQLIQNCIQQAVTTPEAVVAIARLVGGIGERQIFPRLARTEFPENAIDDKARITGGAITFGGSEGGRRGATASHCSSVRSSGFLSKLFFGTNEVRMPVQRGMFRIHAFFLLNLRKGIGN